MSGAFQAGNTGSNPVGDTSSTKKAGRLEEPLPASAGLSGTVSSPPAHHADQAEIAALRQELRIAQAAAAEANAEAGALKLEVERLAKAKDGAYSERNRLVAAFAHLARRLGWPVGIALHPAEDAAWERDWRTILFIDLPGVGQVSWHFHDSERPLVEGLPAYGSRWDGHSTDEKYARLAVLAKTSWGCPACGNAGIGGAHEVCPKCEAPRLEAPDRIVGRFEWVADQDGGGLSPLFVQIRKEGGCGARYAGRICARRAGHWKAVPGVQP